MRQPHQVLVIPYKKVNSEYVYAIFCRVGSKERWQAIAGGVEEGETHLDAAKREANEEASISCNAKYVELESISTIPVVNVTKEFLWGEDVCLIYEHCFGVDATNEKIELSHEHAKYEWLTYEEAKKVLTWDSNRNALWELDWKLNNNKIKED